MRTHCSTCGKKFAVPKRTWAYCNRTCQENRRGINRGEEGDDLWLFKIHTERLDLLDQLSNAPKYLRDEIMQLVEQNQAKEKALRRKLTHLHPTRSHAEFWIDRLRRKEGRYETSCQRMIDCMMKYGRALDVACRAMDSDAEFRRLFDEGIDGVEAPLRFEESARKVMHVSSNPAIYDRSAEKDLDCYPKSLDVLAILADIPAADLEELVATGEVNTQTTKEQATALRSKCSQKGQPCA